MRIDILTLFTDMFCGPFRQSIIKRAKDNKIVSIHIHDIRRWAIDKRGTVDDKPYGGGAGMLMRPEPIFKGVENIIKNASAQNKKTPKPKIILLDAGGIRYTQKKAFQYAKLGHIILICGHYEGVDYRVHKYLANEVLSIGDFVVTGGEIPAMIIADSVIRLLPGVLKKDESTKIESFSPMGDSRMRIEFPQYTRPKNFNGYKVPNVLLSGNHAEIEKWRIKQSIQRSKNTR